MVLALTPLTPGVLLDQQEELQQGEGIAFEYVFVFDLNEVVSLLKARVERDDPAPPPAVEGSLPQNVAAACH